VKYTFSLEHYCPDTRAEMYRWCKENLYHGGHYEPNWDFNLIGNEWCLEFSDEKEYMWFLLRWEGSREVYY